jgi:galactonate dehydratase
MKTTKIEDLHADGAWTTFSFLKVTTDDGLIGWSEYTEGSGSPGLTSVIHALGEALIGQDPRPVQQVASALYQRTVQAPGGVNSRAAAALEHALWDIKGKASACRSTNCSAARCVIACKSTGRIAGPTARGIPIY